MSEPHAQRIDDHPLLGPAPASPTVRFTFNGQALEGRAGEPVAAALLAINQRTFRTMPRTGEPRGGYCMVGRCGDCLMVIDGVAGVQACMTPLREGMHVETQHGYAPLTEADHA